MVVLDKGLPYESCISASVSIPMTLKCVLFNLSLFWVLAMFKQNLTNN